MQCVVRTFVTGTVDADLNLTFRCSCIFRVSVCSERIKEFSLILHGW
jgi:hypothetical protein